MYPTIEILNVTIYTFGTLMACTWILFFILLHKFSLERGVIRPIFTNIIPFTLAIFFFARIFHIMSDWLNEKFIFMELLSGNIWWFLHLFFIPQKYMFSLFGAVFGFILIFLIKTHSLKKDRLRYIDAIFFAFIYSSILGYIASLLGGQVYGIPFHSLASITYTHIDSIVKDKAPLFPLAILYVILTVGIIIGITRWAKGKNLPDGFIGYIGIWAYSLMIVIGEFLSGSRKDMFYDYFHLSLTQIGALLGLIFAVLWILRLIQKRV